MKHFFRATAFVPTFLSTLFSFGQWEWQNPSPAGGYMNAVTFISPAKGWIVGNAGMILHTSDGGMSWEIQQGNTCVDFNCIQFVNENEGWIGGSDAVILHTVDGGENWEGMENTISGSVVSISFVDVNQGWALCSSGVWHTANGATDWTLQNSDISGNCIRFASEAKGWISGFFGAVYRTIDGGGNWSTQNSGVSENLSSISILNEDEAWISGVPGIIHTSNGGANWESQTGNCCHFIQSVSFFDAMNGMAFGNETLWRTTDGGNNWTQDALSGEASDMIMTSANEAYIVGTNEIAHSSDFGDNWENELNIETTANLNDVAFTDEQNGWSVGEGGSILRAVDGGVHWSLQNSGTSSILNAITATGPMESWVVGDMPDTLLHTIDGGNNWMAETFGTGVYLKDVFFLDMAHGWAVGENGTVIRTQNAGLNWQNLSINSATIFRSVFFIDLLHGWMVGELGKIFFSNDGGSSWVEQNSGVGDELHCVHFTSLQEGWIAGSAVLLHTTDGGQNWTVNASGEPFTSVFFADALNGWNTSLYEGVSYTTDGGASWINDTCAPNIFPSDLYVLSSGNAWMVGQTGAIMHFNSGNIPIAVNPMNSDFETMVFPNPGSGDITITSESVLNQISIHDQLGRLVMSCSPNAKRVSVALQNSGVYVLHCISGGNMNRKKIVVSK